MVLHLWPRSHISSTRTNKGPGLTFLLLLLRLLTLLLPQVDGWLEKGVEELEAMVRERSGGSSLSTLVERLLEQQRNFHWQSRLMRNRLFTSD